MDQIDQVLANNEKEQLVRFNLLNNTSNVIVVDCQDLQQQKQQQQQQPNQRSSSENVYSINNRHIANIKAVADLLHDNYSNDESSADEQNDRYDRSK